MRVNFNKPILDLDGNPFIQAEKPVTIAYASKEALLAIYPKEEISADEKVRRFKLAEKIYSSSGDCEISLEEAVLIKKLVGIAYGANVVARVYEALEG